MNGALLPNDIIPYLMRIRKFSMTDGSTSKLNNLNLIVIMRGAVI